MEAERRRMRKVILELGSGARPAKRAGARVIHLDRVESPHVELVADLDHGIPLPSNVVDEVLAIDVLEHLVDLVAAMDEMHRVLVPQGHALIRVPRAGTYNHWTDPTHRRGFTEESMDFFDDRKPLAENGRSYTRRRWSIQSFKEVGQNLQWTMRALKPGEERATCDLWR